MKVKTKRKKKKINEDEDAHAYETNKCPIQAAIFCFWHKHECYYIYMHSFLATCFRLYAL